MDIADRKVGMTDSVEEGQEWRSKRNGRVVKVLRLEFNEDNQVIGAVISDNGKRRTITATNLTIPGYEFLVQDWVDFREASTALGMQNQYASRYVDGRDCPNFGEGLRFRGAGGRKLDVSDYHFIEVHKDDVAEFVRRVTEHRKATFQI